MRLQKAWRPTGESSEIRSRALTMVRCAFMLRGFEYNQWEKVFAMSALFMWDGYCYADGVTAGDYC